MKFSPSLSLSLPSLSLSLSPVPAKKKRVSYLSCRSMALKTLLRALSLLSSRPLVTSVTIESRSCTHKKPTTSRLRISSAVSSAKYFTSTYRQVGPKLFHHSSHEKGPTDASEQDLISFVCLYRSSLVLRQPKGILANTQHLGNHDVWHPRILTFIYK